MLRALVLDALAEGAAAGEDHVARHSLRGIDPAIRWRVRQRVVARVRVASASVADSSDRAHVLRLAFLGEAGCDDVDFEDRVQVLAAFEKASGQRPRPRRFWFASLALAVLILLASSAIVWQFRPRPPPWSPLASPEGEALGADLTAYVSAVYRKKKPSGEAAPETPDASRAHLLGGVERGLGATARDDIDRLLQRYERVVTDEPSDEAEYHELTASLTAVNARFRTARAPYFLDFISDPGWGPILISSYVAKERAASAEEASVRLLRVQRLDNINRSLAAVGYTRPQLGAALVTLDMIEREIVTVVAPALVDKGKAGLADEEARDQRAAWVEPLERRAGEVMRRDYASFRTPAIDRVIERIVRRDELFWGFRRATVHTGVITYRPLTLVARGSIDVLKDRMPDSELREWGAINEELDEDASRAAFMELMERSAARVDRHELQHQIDFRRGLVAVPKELRVLLRMPETMDVGPWSNAARCRDELSADLAAVAAAGDQAGTALVLTASSLFDQGSWGAPHAFGAAVILAEVGRELGHDPGEPFYAARQFDRSRAAALFLKIADSAPRAIADAARRAYGRLFGMEVPAVDWGPWQVAREWRR
jgi:hypothetical protein